MQEPVKTPQTAQGEAAPTEGVVCDTPPPPTPQNTVSGAPGVPYGLKVKDFKHINGKKRKRHSSTQAGKRGWRRRFIEALKHTPNVAYACQKAGVSNTIPYIVRAKDKEFGKAWADALDVGIQGLERAVHDRATYGVPRGVWMKNHKGRIVKVETVYDYSDTLAMFLLKAHRPDRYRETFHQEISGADGAPITLAAAPVVIVWPHQTGNYRVEGNGHGEIKQIEAEVVSGAGGNGANGSQGTSSGNGHTT